MICQTCLKFQRYRGGMLKPHRTTDDVGSWEHFSDTKVSSLSSFCLLNSPQEGRVSGSVRHNGIDLFKGQCPVRYCMVRLYASSFHSLLVHLRNNSRGFFVFALTPIFASHPILLVRVICSPFRWALPWSTLPQHESWCHVLLHKMGYGHIKSLNK